MKYILITGLVIGGFGFPGRAQGVATWVEQLAALRTLEQTVQQGYQTVKNGLDHIGVLRYEEYQLHSAYYGSLETVNPVFMTDPVVIELRENLKKLTLCLEYSLRLF